MSALIVAHQGREKQMGGGNWVATVTFTVAATLLTIMLVAKYIGIMIAKIKSRKS
jgi:hypothetical protein